MKKITKELEGNIKVTISEKEVRLWVCNRRGENIFRFKAVGKVHKAGQDITVLPILLKVTSQLYDALIAVYRDIELQNVKGGTDELNFIVQQALAKAEGKETP